MQHLKSFWLLCIIAFAFPRSGAEELVVHESGSTLPATATLPNLGLTKPTRALSRSAITGIFSADQRRDFYVINAEGELLRFDVGETDLPPKRIGAVDLGTGGGPSGPGCSAQSHRVPVLTGRIVR